MAALEKQLKQIIGWVQANQTTTDKNKELFEIWEGDLLSNVLKDYKSKLKTPEQSNDKVAHKTGRVFISSFFSLI